MCVCSPISGNVLRPRKRREGRIAPLDRHLPGHATKSPELWDPPRALEVGAPRRVPLEPALSSSAGPHLEKCGRVGVGGQEPQVLETGSKASSRPDHTAYPRAQAEGTAGEGRMVDATYLEFEEFQ